MSVAVGPAPGPQLCAGHAAASAGPGEHFFDLCGVFDGQLAAFLLLEGLLEGLPSRFGPASMYVVITPLVSYTASSLCFAPLCCVASARCM